MMMYDVVFSIKPQFAEAILKGIKKFEYRKKQLRRTNIRKILIYSTKPVSAIVGEAEIRRIWVDVPDQVWDCTKEHSGIQKDFYDEYFSGTNLAVAYELCNVRQYNIPKSLHEVGLAYIPQSFAYVEKRVDTECVLLNR